MLTNLNKRINASLISKVRGIHTLSRTAQVLTQFNGVQQNAVSQKGLRVHQMMNNQVRGILGVNMRRDFSEKVIKVPGMGDSISEGVIEEFVKQPGDYVEADEIIARIETDKVTVDIPAPEAGVIK